jgi:hypothetical protein
MEEEASKRLSPSSPQRIPSCTLPRTSFCAADPSLLLRVSQGVRVGEHAKNKKKLAPD